MEKDSVFPTNRINCELTAKQVSKIFPETWRLNNDRRGKNNTEEAC